MRTTLVALLPALLIPLAGQERPMADSGVYRVEFRIRDRGDSAANAGRQYAILINAGYKGVLKIGQKVPYATGSVTGNSGQAIPTQINYADVGANIDCRLSEAGQGVLVRASLEFSALEQPDKNPGALGIRVNQTRVEVNAVVIPGKPALVASVDDPVTHRNVDVQVTVTKL